MIDQDNLWCVQQGVGKAQKHVAWPGGDMKITTVGLQDSRSKVHWALSSHLASNRVTMSTGQISSLPFI